MSEFIVVDFWLISSIFLGGCNRSEAQQGEGNGAEARALVFRSSSSQGIIFARHKGTQ